MQKCADTDMYGYTRVVCEGQYKVKFTKSYETFDKVPYIDTE